MVCVFGSINHCPRLNLMIQIKATAVCTSGTKHPLSMHGPLPIKLNISSQRACHCLPFLLPGNSGMPFPVCHEVPTPHLGNGSRKETAGAESGRAVDYLFP